MPPRRAGTGSPGLALASRSFLFLQGPQSRFFERVARALVACGHRAHRLNLNLGDRLFWHMPATDFRGRPSDWPNFIARLIEDHSVTDLILLGDQRPYHIVAAETARARAITVWALDLGYVRPGWLTLEQDGVAGASHFPRDAHSIRALAKDFPEPDFAPVAMTPFWQLAARDVAYHVAATLGRPLYPHYRRHGLYHPFAEYAAWIGNAPRRLVARRATAAAKSRLAAERGGVFLYPLQLATDFAMRAHSPFSDARGALDTVLRSFADSGSGRRLVVVAHPLDEGLIDWRRLIAGHGRVVFLEGGVTEALVANAAGVVTVNSTTGLTALRLGVPVKPLGSAIYDVPGLTDQGDLAGFWQRPNPPDREFIEVFVRALIGATQIKGGYYAGAAQCQALPAFVERLENGPYPMTRRSTYAAAANDGG
jgi:capsular polysaccharide export protein